MKNNETYLYAFHYDWKFFCFHQFADAATPLQVVQKELQHISNKQPVLYSKLWIRSMQNAILFHHSDNIRHEDTISNVTKSSLVKVKQLPLQKHHSTSRDYHNIFLSLRLRMCKCIMLRRVMK